MKPALPFPEFEYRRRRDRVRDEMAARGVDVLYVTSPPNLLYLTGYQAIWYPPRLPVGAVLVRDAPDVVAFDWVRHEGYVRDAVLCDDAVFFEYADAVDVAVEAFRSRGWLDGAVGLEESAANPSPALLDALTRGLTDAGGRVVSGDWVVDRVRLYKSDAELERVRTAADMADRAFERLAGELRPGISELEVSARIAALLAEEGSEIAATPPLVSSGPDAWRDTHAFPGHRLLQRGDVVSVDACGVVDRYHANLSRTYALGEVSPVARELLEQAAGSVDELVRAARLGEGPEAAAAAAERYVRERIAPERIWWVGGYALGLALPPSWVGHTYLANDGPQRCLLMPGYVSNFENVFFDEHEGFAADFIETVVMTETGLEVLSRLPRTLIDVAV
jgi:Xaa-Pro aminopeptidase